MDVRPEGTGGSNAGGGGGQDLEEGGTSTLRAIFAVFIHINGR